MTQLDAVDIWTENNAGLRGELNDLLLVVVRLGVSMGLFFAAGHAKAESGSIGCR
jgi:hypothetical protein